MDKICVIFVTCSGTEEAQKIGRHLVETRVAACVNVIPQVQSIYRWEGAVQDDAESLLICKTRKDRVEAFMREVQSIHSYDVPELVCVEADAVEEQYASWLMQETRVDDL
tara:strand:+ start:721 stop:1050 length:330 start_codon:yes stop_codon:yes gene_type:complete